MLAPLDIALFVFLLTCGLTDLRTRRIPNEISGTALLAGIILNALSYGTPGFIGSVSGIMVMTAVLLAPFALGGLGGGDVKMMAAVGAFLGPRLGLLSLTAGMMLGGVVAVIHLARIGQLTEKVLALTSMVMSASVTRSVAPLRISADDAGAISLPYSIPLGIGTAAVVIATALST